MPIHKYIFSLHDEALVIHYLCQLLAWIIFLRYSTSQMSLLPSPLFSPLFPSHCSPHPLFFNVTFLGGVPSSAFFGRVFATVFLLLLRRVYENVQREIWNNKNVHYIVLRVSEDEKFQLYYYYLQILYALLCVCYYICTQLYKTNKEEKLFFFFLPNFILCFFQAFYYLFYFSDAKLIQAYS